MLAFVLLVGVLGASPPEQLPPVFNFPANMKAYTQAIKPECLTSDDSYRRIRCMFAVTRVVQHKNKCGIETFVFEEEMTLTSVNTWVNKADHQGICKVVTMIVLEHLDSNNWRYTQTNISASTTPKGSCSEIGSVLNKPDIYSTQYKAPSVSCGSIEFGPGVRYEKADSPAANK